jgi:hypothetical protein
MNTPQSQVNGSGRPRHLLRRSHRWVGTSLLLFVILLAVSGITLNHGDTLGLDRRYVNWTWILDAYGIQMPAPGASYADAEHRVTLVGERLYFNGRDIEQRTPALTGFVSLGPLVVAAGGSAVRILTADGDPVEVIELSGLAGSIERVGRYDGRAILQSAGNILRSDEDVAEFLPWTDSAVGDIHWSEASAPNAAELSALERAYRGRGLTVERLLLDLHSGRILSLPGTLFMDFVGICMVVLGISGLVISRSRNRRANGAK